MGGCQENPKTLSFLAFNGITKFHHHPFIRTWPDLNIITRKKLQIVRFRVTSNTKNKVIGSLVLNSCLIESHMRQHIACLDFLSRDPYAPHMTKNGARIRFLIVIYPFATQRMVPQHPCPTGSLFDTWPTIKIIRCITIGFKHLITHALRP